MRVPNVLIDWSDLRRNIRPQPIAHGRISTDTPRWGVLMLHQRRSASMTRFWF